VSAPSSRSRLIEELPPHFDASLAKMHVAPLQPGELLERSKKAAEVVVAVDVGLTSGS
jgi:hypothetical protein